MRRSDSRSDGGPEGPEPEAAVRLATLAHEQRTATLLTLAHAALLEPGAGAHRSTGRGAGTDFADHKPYAPGDDLRMLDWRLAARSDRLVVRQYESQRPLRAAVVVDVSASMEYGSVDARGDTPGTKSEVAAHAAAILGGRLLMQGDSAQLGLAGRGIREFPMRRGGPQVAAWCQDVAHGLPAGDAGCALGEAIAGAVARLGRPGLLAVCTDALDEDESWVEGLTEARARGHGVLVLHVVDPAERDLPFADPAAFEGLEGETSVHAHPARIRRLYRELFAEHVDRLRSRLLDARVDHVELDVGRPVAWELDAALAPGRTGGARRWS